MVITEPERKGKFFTWMTPLTYKPNFLSQKARKYKQCLNHNSHGLKRTVKHLLNAEQYNPTGQA